MSGKKKMVNRMARHVMDGTVSVNQVRAVLGKKPLVGGWGRRLRRTVRRGLPLQRPRPRAARGVRCGTAGLGATGVRVRTGYLLEQQ